jgi:hypothetical protein
MQHNMHALSLQDLLNLTYAHVIGFGSDWTAPAQSYYSPHTPIVYAGFLCWHDAVLMRMMLCLM